MSKTAAFEINFEDFDRKFIAFAVHEAPDAARQGIKDAIDQLYQDALTVEPTVPKKEGTLRAQADKAVEVSSDSIVGTLTFTQPYAHRRHEEERGPVSGKPVVFTEPGSGPKYVETKIVRFMKDYIGIVRDSITAKMAKLGAAK
jgi:hypothetical protein